MWWFSVLGLLSFFGPFGLRNIASTILAWLFAAPILLGIYVFVVAQPTLDKIACGLGSEVGCYSLTQFEVSGITTAQYKAIIANNSSVTVNRRWWVVRKEKINGNVIRTLQACYGKEVPIYDFAIEEQCFDRQVLNSDGTVINPPLKPLNNYRIDGYWNGLEKRVYTDGRYVRLDDIRYYWNKAVEVSP